MGQGPLLNVYLPINEMGTAVQEEVGYGGDMAEEDGGQPSLSGPQEQARVFSQGWTPFLPSHHLLSTRTLPHNHSISG